MPKSIGPLSLGMAVNREAQRKMDEDIAENEDLYKALADDKEND